MKTLLIQCLFAVFAIPLTLAADSQPKPPELEVSILRYEAGRRAIVVRFENHSLKPLKLLRPIDGSEWGWHMPIYDVSMTDTAGKAVPLAERCGNSGLYADMKWPDDYLIQILPGDAYEMSVRIVRDNSLVGRFTVRFRYTYEPAAKSPGRDSRIKYPDDLWVGSTISVPLDIEIPKLP